MPAKHESASDHVGVFVERLLVRLRGVTERDMRGEGEDCR